MISLLELVSDETYKGFFVDLYVRCTNTVAIDMYEGLGYSVFRRVREYYGSLGVGKGAMDEEDAFGLCFYFGLLASCTNCGCLDMRKPLARDPHRRSVRANGRDMIVSAHSVS